MSDVFPKASGRPQGSFRVGFVVQTPTPCECVRGKGSLGSSVLGATRVQASSARLKDKGHHGEASSTRMGTVGPLLNARLQMPLDVAFAALRACGCHDQNDNLYLPFWELVGQTPGEIIEIIQHEPAPPGCYSA